MNVRNEGLPVRVGRFRVDSMLGRGGMGEVYRAFDPTLQRTVAIKTVRPDLLTPESRARLLREAQACARLQHPNIVTVHDAGEVDGLVYIAMEYLQGRSLADALHEPGFGYARRLRVLIDILGALQHAHAQGVIHRDVKPRNVHCLPDGTVKLVDFGLARAPQSASLTSDGVVLGTLHYASPEQLRGEELDARTDIFSTGVLAYELFTGRLPFGERDDTASAVMLRVIGQPPRPMDTLIARELPELVAIVERAMAKAPADRFASAEAMRVALEGLLERSTATLARLESASGATTAVAAQVPGWAQGTTVTAPAGAGPEAAPARAFRRWWLAAPVVLALAVGLGWWTRARHQEPAPRDVGAPRATASATTDAPIVEPAPSTSTPPAVGRGPTATPAANDPVRSEHADEPAPSADVPARAAEPPAAEPGARALFAAPAPASSAANAGVRYRVIRRTADGAEADVDTATTFHSGDRVRFAFESSIDGYLYVVQQGSSGRWTVLFPSPEINGGRNAVRRQERYVIPGEDWFLFDETPGSEQVFVFLSREAIPQLPGFDRPVRQVESLAAPVVDGLRQQVQSRDLVFEKQRSPAGSAQAVNATYVVNRSQFGKAVAASFTLTHVP
ncbi:serine/threonine-protein kinase [Luteitalea sp. TBR-22]|uniref:serine/threonine-protein kinase n=1 Tax=Luteitalea sp. TBR-22 TaxID=2802971 RepID=UPI001EF67AE2|nr:serine/threonine-protein kinase [Luteitalea sp. TBR-22]